MPMRAIKISSQKLSRAAACALAGFAALLALPTAAASAAGLKSPAGPLLCEGQLFSQPFAAFEEEPRYFTLAPGGEFNSPSEGWTLTGGAHLAEAMRPEGTTGGVLDLPAGATATSPPVCVTLAYPVSRVWVDGPKGHPGVLVAVSYEGTKSELEPRDSGSVRARHGTWTLGEFKVDPRLAGKEEAPREVKFVFEGKPYSESQLFDVYIDPRMR